MMYEMFVEVLLQYLIYDVWNVCCNTWGKQYCKNLNLKIFKFSFSYQQTSLKGNNQKYWNGILSSRKQRIKIFLIYYIDIVVDYIIIINCSY